MVSIDVAWFLAYIAYILYSNYLWYCFWWFDISVHSFIILYSIIALHIVISSVLLICTAPIATCVLCMLNNLYNYSHIHQNKTKKIFFILQSHEQFNTVYQQYARHRMSNNKITNNTNKTKKIYLFIIN